MKKRRRRSAMIGTDLLLAPMVAMMRLPLMSAEAGNLAAVPTETLRATGEKVAAAVEGVMAVQMAYAGAMMSFWPEVLTGRNPSIFSSTLAQKAATAAIRPSSVRVRANYRRLSK